MQELDEIVDTKFEKIVFCYVEEQPLYNLIREANPSIIFVKGYSIEMEETYLSGDTLPKLLIVDDQMTELAASSDFLNLFIRRSTHNNVSVFMIIHNIFHKSKCLRDINLQSTGFLLFRNPRSLDQISHLSRQINPSNWRFVLDCYQKSTDKPFQCLYIDLHPLTESKYRYRCGIIPSERMIIFRE